MPPKGGGSTIAKCQWCGEDFKVWNSLLKTGRGKHCSRQCYTEQQKNNLLGASNPSWKGGKVALVCEICGDIFHVFRYTAMVQGRKFCSKKCMGIKKSMTRGKDSSAWRGGKVECHCQICGKSFMKFKSGIEYGQGKFCSCSCKNKWWSLASSLDKNPSWLGGKSLEPYTRDFGKRAKKYIRNRDRNECILCGKVEDKREPAVHHIDYNKKNSQDSNLVSLCHKCHIETNINRSYWRVKLSNIIGMLGY